MKNKMLYISVRECDKAIKSSIDLEKEIKERCLVSYKINNNEVGFCINIFSNKQKSYPQLYNNFVVKTIK